MSSSRTTSDDSIVLPADWSVTALLLLLLIGLPIVVSMPLTSDTVLYDLQARNILDGGVMYRDILEPNLPGAVWLHLLIRSVGGWSSEVMRISDLLIVATACIVLISSQRIKNTQTASSNNSDGTRVDFAAKASISLLAMAVFYLSRNEWCHCQRDSWMLLPVALAAALRMKSQWHESQVKRYRVRLLAICEGICWGAAFWIKPHVAFSAIAVFSVDLWIQSDRSSELRRLLWVIAGGVLVAIPGVAWLIQSGAWNHFWDMQLNWNPEYVAAARSRRSWPRVWSMLLHFHPWWIVHCLAIGKSIQLFNILRNSKSEQKQATSGKAQWMSSTARLRAVTLLSVIYLSWFAQASLLQHSMDYIQVPPVILAIALISMSDWTIPILIRRITVAAFAGIALLVSPQLQPQRISMWISCLRFGSTPAVREKLACVPLPDWAHLVPVTEYLKRQNVQAGDVTCFNVHCIHVYSALNIPPSSRYVGISSLLELFPSRRAAIQKTVETCGHRFVVTDIRETEPVSDCFPWNLPLAFESGDFRVYEAYSAQGNGTADVRHLNEPTEPSISMSPVDGFVTTP